MQKSGKGDGTERFENGVLDTMRRATEQAPRISLLIYHRHGTMLVPLDTDGETVIGRAGDIAVPDNTLSRRHARFTPMGGSVRVEDLDSTNGTWHREERIKQLTLGPKDEVRLGAVVVQVHERVTAESPGLLDHEAFCNEVDKAVARAAATGARVGVMMVRSAGERPAHMSQWWPRLRDLLGERPCIGFYGPGIVEVALFDTSRERLAEIGDALTASGDPVATAGRPALLLGAALYPDAASTGAELLQIARAALQGASEARSVRVAADDRSSIVSVYQAESPSVRAGGVVLEGRFLREIAPTLERCAKSRRPVLIEGETGCGKEVIARLIHYRSQRSARPMVAINSGAMPEALLESELFGHVKGAFSGAIANRQGLFEAAEGGTLFLDEVGEMPLSMQVRLLRILDAGTVRPVGGTREVRVDVRVIAATHRDLKAMVDKRQFREDLYHRLHVLPLRIRPLREREDEIEGLAAYFLAEANRAEGRNVTSIEVAALRLLQAHAWPGNVRELKNVIERAVVMAEGDVIRVEDLPESLQQAALKEPQSPRREPIGSERDTTLPQDGQAFEDSMRDHSRALLISVLEECGWNQTLAAKRLQMPRRTLVWKLRKLGIARPAAGAPDEDA